MQLAKVLDLQKYFRLVNYMREKKSVLRVP